MAARVIGLVFAAAAMATAGLQTQQDWTAAGTKGGVTLTYRDVPELDAREVRAVAALPHASDRIISVACDFTQRLDPDTREARVLSGEIDGRYQIYLRYSPRYLVVSARDVVIDVQREANGCSWSEVAGRMPPQSGAVRMPLLRGSWKVEALEPKRSRVTYQIAVRPGGGIPAWLVRRGAVSALPDVIERISECLTKAEGRAGPCPKLVPR